MTSKLRKTRTMANTANEGTEYLKRSWDNDKLNVVSKAIEQRQDLVSKNDDTEDEVEEVVETPKKKAKLAKHTTMNATAKEAKALLNDVEIDTDAKTRHQSKAIKEITSETVEEPKKRKPKLAKNTTMNVTAKEGKALLGGEEIDTDAKTRNQSKAIKEITSEKPKPTRKKKPALRKANTMKNTAKEGKGLLKGEKLGGTRAKTSTKKAAAAKPKPKLTKSRTMKETAKEGKAFVKSFKGKKNK